MSAALRHKLSRVLWKHYRVMVSNIAQNLEKHVLENRVRGLGAAYSIGIIH